MRVLGIEVHRATPAGGPLRWMLDLVAPDVVVDVGANEGQFLDEVRKAGWGGPIIALEPIPSLAATLAREGVTVHAVAAGEQDATAELTVTRDTSISSLHQFNDFATTIPFLSGSPSAMVKTVTVPVRRLDALLADVPGRLFVKLDTQGHDLPALRGLAGVLDRVVGLQSELAFQPIYEGVESVGPHLEEVRRHGFVLAALEPVTRAPNGGLIEADGLFVRVS